MSGQSTSVVCSHCGGELTFSHIITTNNNISVYICKECGERTEIT